MCLVSNFIQNRSTIRAMLIVSITFRLVAELPNGEKLLSQKGSPMFTADQYRAKAVEYSKLARIANGPNEMREYQRLERDFTELAGNAQWMIDNHDKIVPAQSTPQQ
jgi:hypothetical protein